MKHAWVPDYVKREEDEDTFGWTLVLHAHCDLCGAKAAFKTTGECGGIYGHFGSVDITGAFEPQEDR